MHAPRYSVSLALVRRNGAWLVARRHPDAHLGDKWEFPGGKNEPGESAPVAAIRELREECGVEAVAVRVLPAVSQDYGDRVIDITPVVCDWSAGEARPIGCVECRWASLQEIAQLDMPAVNAGIIERIRALGT